MNRWPERPRKSGSYVFRFDHLQGVFSQIVQGFECVCVFECLHVDFIFIHSDY